MKNKRIRMFTPYQQPIPLPDLSGSGVSVFCYPTAFKPYIAGLLKGLVAYSTWDTTDDALIAPVVKAAQDVIEAFLEDCTLPAQVQFRQVGCLLQASFDSGVTWGDIYDFAASCGTGYVALNPANSIRNNITSQNADNVALALFNRGDASALVINQSFYAPQPSRNQPAVSVQAYHGPAMSLLSDTGPLLQRGADTLLDNLGRHLLQPTSDPLPGSVTRGTIWLGLDGNSDDAPFIVTKDHLNAYHKTSLIGPPGSNGADGTTINGATATLAGPLDPASAVLTNNPDATHRRLDITIPQSPEIDTVTATTLPPGSSATAALSVEGSGNKLLTLGIPRGNAGPPGPAGSVTFPGLPLPGGVAVSWDMIIPWYGAQLPWTVPPGYTISIDNVRGKIRLLDAPVPYIVDGLGTAHDVLANGFRLGRLLLQGHVLDPNMVAAIDKPLTDIMAVSYLTTDYEDITLASNNLDPTGPGWGYFLAQITVTPSAAPGIGVYYQLRNHNVTNPWIYVPVGITHTIQTLPAVPNPERAGSALETDLTILCAQHAPGGVPADWYGLKLVTWSEVPPNDDVYGHPPGTHSYQQETNILGGANVTSAFFGMPVIGHYCIQTERNFGQQTTLTFRFDAA